MTVDLLREYATTVTDELVGWRRRFHRRAELELDCHETAEFVASELRSLGVRNIRMGLAKSGLVAVIEGGEPGETVGVRLEMDALPVQEETAVDYQSERPGVAHACGHDGHMAIGLGVAKTLLNSGCEFRGNVKLIYEPGEEYPGGAPLMIRDGALEDPRVSAVVGFHIFPELEQGIYGLREGVMTASNEEFTIEIRGRGGHGAYPHRCRDPIAAAGTLITAVQNIVARAVDPVDPVVVSIGEVRGGKGHNVIPPAVTLKGTVRSVSVSARRTALERLRAIGRGVAEMHEVTCDIKVVAVEPSLCCTPELTGIARELLCQVVGPERVRSIEHPSLGAESFAFYSEVVPVTYFRIGSRNEAKGYVDPLHSPRFNFDEGILPEAVFVVTSLALRVLDRLNRLA